MKYLTTALYIAVILSLPTKKHFTPSFMLNPTKFEDLFASDDTTFEVPPYQRAYAWRDKQLNQLLLDLREQPKNKAYYLGHFLLERPNRDKAHYHIVDGQQRISTVIMFFSCLIDELKGRREKGENILDVDGWAVDTDRWENRYLRQRGVRRFHTVKLDDQYFELAFVSRRADAKPDANRQSQQRLAKGKHLLTGAMSTEPTAILVRWAHLLAKASISAFEESDKVRATQIFAFQNDRGADLTTLEKLKAFLMYQAYLNDESAEAARTVEAVESRFADIYSLTEEIGLSEDTVLRYHNVAFGATWEDAFENVKLSLRNAPRDAKASWLVEYCDSLRQSFRDAKTIQRLAEGHSHSTGLLFLQAENNWPLLLKIQHYHPADTNHALREQLYRLMEIVNFKFEFSTGEYRSHDFHGLAKRYAGNANELKEMLRERAHNGFQWYWKFTGNFHDKLNGDYHYHRSTRYLLWQYENWLRRQSPNGGEPVSGGAFMNIWKEGSWEKTLDHITPQQPDDMQYSKEFNEKRLHNIGNLALMMQGPNSRKSNTLPQDFLSIFTESTYLADREIAKAIQSDGSWNEAQILARKQRIVDFAKAHWAVPEN